MPPVPADSHDTALTDILRERIRREGPMPVDTYMQLCLTHPVHGYWRKSGNIGAGGDFITAPEISQIFGELIGLWCAVAWQGLGRPGCLRLVELGPGRGTLMRDALRAAKMVPGFLASLTIHLIELSEPLRQAQRETLASSPRRRDSMEPSASDLPGNVNACLRTHDNSHKGNGQIAIDWHDSLDQVPPGPVIVIANEFLDALPIRQLVFHEGSWCERVIEIDDEGLLRFVAGAKVKNPDADSPAPAQGSIVELRAAENELLAQLARRPSPVLALFVDYGPALPASGDTLQAVHDHTYVDPLTRPGGADLTAHVNFASLAHKVRQAGLAADGPLTQAEFLGRLGAAERAARLMAANPRLAGEIEAGAQRLMSPTGMGELFKVMAVRSAGLPPLPPFG